MIIGRDRGVDLVVYSPFDSARVETEITNKISTGKKQEREKYKLNLRLMIERQTCASRWIRLLFIFGLQCQGMKALAHP